jgi:hypothetical protein
LRELPRLEALDDEAALLDAHGIAPDSDRMAYIRERLGEWRRGSG